MSILLYVLKVNQYRRERNAKILLGLVLLAIAYSGLLHYLDTLTGTDLLDGGIGVLLGLYICSHPAANAMNFLFFERGIIRQVPSRLSDIGWLGLNVLVILFGWIVIVIGTMRFVGRVG